MKLLNIGNMNLKNKLTTLFLGFVMCVSAQKNKYPQSMILKGDTIIAFTREQALKLTQMNEENKSYKLIVIKKDSVIAINKELLVVCDSNYEKTLTLNNDYKSILDKKNIQISTYVENEKILKQEIDRQKKYKNYSLIGGGAILLISYITLLLK
jgi:hypothetical protein